MSLLCTCGLSGCNDNKKIVLELLFCPRKNRWDFGGIGYELTKKLGKMANGEKTKRATQNANQWAKITYKDSSIKLETH